MTLNLRILRSLTRLFIILVSLIRSLFSEKMLISNRCISVLISNLIKKSWAVFNVLGTCLYPIHWKRILDIYSFLIHMNEKEWISTKFPPLNNFRSLGRKEFKFSLHKAKIIETTRYFKFSAFDRCKKQYVVSVETIRGNKVQWMLVYEYCRDI